MYTLTDAALLLRAEQECVLQTQYRGQPVTVEEYFEGLYFTKINETIEGEIRVRGEVLYRGPLPLAVRNDSGVKYIYVETDLAPLKFPVIMGTFRTDERLTGVFI